MMTTVKTILAAVAMATLSVAAVPLVAQTAAPASAVTNPGATQTAPQGAAIGGATGSPTNASPPVAAAPAPAAGASAATATAPANAIVTDAQAAASAAKPSAPPLLAPDPNVGMPTPMRMGLQEQVTDVGNDARWMHNAVLMPIVTIITLFVLFLLIYVVARYRRSAHPIPSRTSHNTTIEVIWTLAPVLLLVIIAVPSIRLLAKQYAPPKADLTVKVIGNQWYWTYQYPDNGDFEVVSNMLKDKGDPSVAAGTRTRTDLDGPHLLAVDERMVVPAGAVVKLIVTSNDVIHSFAVPAFWNKMDAVPGRLNETWFKVDRPGVYFGQCSELCGARHGFMPISVEVVPPAMFRQWIASKGGTMPGAGGAKGPDSTSAASPATAGPATTGGSPHALGLPGSAPSDPVVAGTAAPTSTTQGATANEGSQTR